MCAGGLDQQHAHLVAKQTSAPMCVCHACYHVFCLVTNGRSHHGDDARYYYFPTFSADATHDELNLPIGLTFMFRTAPEDRLVTWSPNPGGAIETVLPDTTWPTLIAANPGVDTLRPLRDALLLRHTPPDPVDDSCVLLPSQACFELIGTAKSGYRHTLAHFQPLNAAMEELWAWARAKAPSVPRHMEAPQG